MSDMTILRRFTDEIRENHLTNHGLIDEVAAEWDNAENTTWTLVQSRPSAFFTHVFLSFHHSELEEA